MPSLRDKAHDGVCVNSVLEHQLDLPEARITYNSVRSSHIEAMNVNIPTAFKAHNLFCVTKCMTNNLIFSADTTISNFYSIFCMSESYTSISLSSLADTVDTNAVGLSAWQNSCDCMTK
jgi:hypothetical protein